MFIKGIVISVIVLMGAGCASPNQAALIQEQQKSIQELNNKVEKLSNQTSSGPTTLTNSKLENDTHTTKPKALVVDSGKELDALKGRLDDCCTVPNKELAIYDINIKNTDNNIKSDSKSLESIGSTKVSGACLDLFNELVAQLKFAIQKDTVAKDTTEILKSMKVYANTQAQIYINNILNNEVVDQQSINSFILKSSAEIKEYQTYNLNILKEAVKAQDDKMVKYNEYKKCEALN